MWTHEDEVHMHRYMEAAKRHSTERLETERTIRENIAMRRAKRCILMIDFYTDTCENEIAGGGRATGYPTIRRVYRFVMIYHRIRVMCSSLSQRMKLFPNMCCSNCKRVLAIKTSSFVIGVGLPVAICFSHNDILSMDPLMIRPSRR